MVRKRTGYLIAVLIAVIALSACTSTPPLPVSTPTATPTFTITPAPSSTFTATPANTSTPTSLPTATATPFPTLVPPTVTPTWTVSAQEVLGILPSPPSTDSVVYARQDGAVVLHTLSDAQERVLLDPGTYDIAGDNFLIPILCPARLSPDGQWLLAPTPERGDWLVSLDGQTRRQVSEQRLSFTWAPDSRRIAFQAGEAIYAQDVVAGTEPVLVARLADDQLSTPSGLVIEAYALKGPPQVEPLTFEPVQGAAQEILQKRQAERDKRVKRVWKTSGETSVAFGEGLLVATEIYTDTAEGQVGAVQVTYGESVIYTVPLGPASPIDKLRGLWVHDDHWYLEVADWQGRGQVIRDGESLNDRDGCEETFGFQLLRGRPFWFYRREGRIGVSFDGQETLLGYEDVRHYECCSMAEANPIRAENMVAFFALRDGTWYYVEMGVYE